MNGICCIGLRNNGLSLLPSCHGSHGPRGPPQAPLPQTGPLGLCLFQCFFLFFSRPWASRQLPGPSPAAACACCELLRTCHATCPQTALAPLGRPLGSSPCPLPAMGSPCPCHAGRGVQPPLLSCKEKGESNGRVTCDRCRPCCRASHGPLVTCQALKT